MNDDNLHEIRQVEEFLSSAKNIACKKIGTKSEVYTWIKDILVKFQYLQLRKKDKGVIIRYLIKMTNYSRQQITRLIKRYRQCGQIMRLKRIKTGFLIKYTAEDVRQLVRLDELHGTPNGSTLKKLCEREFELFKQPQYKRLAGISVSHLYNIRNSIRYKRQRYFYKKTKPKASILGIRRKPEPNNQPGFIRIDTVHQGDLDKKKGVYHINAVDEVTQFEIIGSVAKITAEHLVPVIKSILDAFPFKIKGFHSDNGSEYVNQDVVALLNKSLIEFTKSRPRRSNDNGLVETKNGAVIRKVLGYTYIPQCYAAKINEFNQKYLNPHINFHRPSLFSTTIVDKKGKEKKVYRYSDVATPYDKLKSLPNAESYLKPGVTFEGLDKEAFKISDSESARQLNIAQQKLFQQIFEQKDAV